MKKIILFLCILLSCTAVFAKTDILDGYVTMPYSDTSDGSNYYEFRYIVKEDYTKMLSSEEDVKEYLKEISRAIILTDQTFIGIFMTDLPFEEKVYQPEKDSDEYKKVLKELRLKSGGKKVQTFTQIALAARSAIIRTHIEWNGKIYTKEVAIYM